MDEKLMQQLLALFAEEAQEHLEALNHNLLTLEKDPPLDQIDQLLEVLLREAHSLKGAARSVNSEAVESLLHELETLIGQMKRERKTLTEKGFDRVYQALDAADLLVRGTTMELEEARADVDVEATIQLLKDTGILKDLEQESALEPACSTQRDPKQHPKRTVQKSLEETVRISTEKLDSLMALLSELQAARIQQKHLQVRVNEVFNQIKNWEAEWRKVRSGARWVLREDEKKDRQHAQSLSHLALSDRKDEIVEFLQVNEKSLQEVQAQILDLREAFEGDHRRFTQISGELQEEVLQARMQPVSNLFATFPRMVRDLASEQKKKVNLLIRGGDTEVDRTVLEGLKDPLTHLLRNAVVHGIELPQNRKEWGKTESGTIKLSARQVGDNIQIQVEDDGAGVDVEGVVERAVEMGSLGAEQADGLSYREGLNFIFQSGVSTSPMITNLSGRGVGLDVVRDHIDRLRGSIQVTSSPEEGTSLTLTLPLTVSTTLVLLVEVGGQKFALPLSNIVQCVAIHPDEVQFAYGMAGIQFEGHPISLNRLENLLGMQTKPGPSLSQRKAAVVIRFMENQKALLVDKLVGTQEVVIKSLPAPFRRVQLIAGATILGSGEVIPILNLADLFQVAQGEGTFAADELLAAPKAEPSAKTILLAEDSMTTRAMEKNILEAAGYEVKVASNGTEAWDMLDKEDFDLLVTDILMPGMDGFELTERVRADERFKHLPVILVTSLGSRQDHERGVEVGADAYITKGTFDQGQFLAAIRRLI